MPRRMINGWCVQNLPVDAQGYLYLCGRFKEPRKNNALCGLLFCQYCIDCCTDTVVDIGIQIGGLLINSLHVCFLLGDGRTK